MKNRSRKGYDGEVKCWPVTFSQVGSPRRNKEPDVCLCVCAYTDMGVAVPYLNPGICGTQVVEDLHPRVYHLDYLVSLHEREGDIRPGMETHDLTGPEVKKEVGKMI